MDAAINAGVRDVLEYWSLAVLVCDAHGSISDCNVHAQRILMMSRVELLNAGIQELIPGVDFLITRTPSEYTARRRRQHECATEVVVHNEGARYVVVFSDTTGAERRTQELIKMWEAAIDGIVTINRYGFIESINRSAERITGYAAEEVVGSNVSVLMPERYARNHDGYIRKYIQTGIRHIIGLGREVMLQRKDGGEEPIELSVSEFSTQGSLKFVGTLRSLSERNSMDSQLKGLAKDKLDFLAAICHEIRTPINGIVCATELLRDYIEHPEAREYLNTLDACSNILKNITRDTLDYAKLEGHTLEVVPVTFNLKSLLDSLHAQYALMVKDKSIMLDVQADFNTNINVVADDLRLAQVLNNLVANAIKFTEQNGFVRIRVSKKERIEETRAGFSSANRVDLLFTVSDTGTGVSPEMLPRLFRPFSQGGSNRMNRYDGTGLGLSICKSLVTLMGGSIDMYNNRDATGRLTGLSEQDRRGASFNFSIPVAVEAAPVWRPEPPRSNINNPDAHVLIVEDNFINQTLVRKMLERKGVRKENISVAANGVEALEAIQGLRGSTPDVILMDCQMPIMNGFEATRRIRELGVRTPIVALTASTVHDDIEDCFRAGMSFYLSKPVNISDLINAINRFTPATAATSETPAH